jgi:hypothetical protein
VLAGLQQHPLLLPLQQHWQRRHLRLLALHRLLHQGLLRLWVWRLGCLLLLVLSCPP